MNLITFLLVGLIAGSLAKMMTRQEEKGGWVSSLIVGVLGSYVGGFVVYILGFSTHNILAELIVAFSGALIVLFIYHKYLADKMNHIM